MTRGGQREGRLEPFAAPLVVATALPGLALLLVVAGRYGYHRDELYFLACSRHLAWGFVDQPPITPALARVADLLAPGSLAVLRLWPALMYVALVFLTGVIARELGAGRTGQVAAAAATAAGTGPLVAGHLLSTQTLDLDVWAVVVWLVIRLVRTGDPRTWIGIGIVAGIGVENKWTLAFLLTGLLLALLTTPHRRLLMTWWFAGGAAIGLALWAPNLVWQASHDWPQLDLLTAIRERSGGAGPLAAWLPFQLLLMGPVMAPVAIAGFVRLLRGPDVRPYRFIAFALIGLGLVMCVVAPDKPYYVSGFYAPLAGAGGVPVQRWLARRQRRPSRWLIPAALGLGTLALLPIILPIAPERDLADLSVIDEQLESVGWPQLAATVADVWHRLPPEERRETIILTANYGEAGLSIGTDRRSACRRPTASTTAIGGGASRRRRRGPSCWSAGRARTPPGSSARRTSRRRSGAHTAWRTKRTEPRSSSRPIHAARSRRCGARCAITADPTRSSPPTPPSTANVWATSGTRPRTASLGRRSSR